MTSLANFQDDAEEESYWFIYRKPLSSTGSPILVEQSKLLNVTSIRFEKCIMVENGP